VKNRFQNLPFKCNLQRYTAEYAAKEERREAEAAAKLVAAAASEVGLCTLTHNP
jgi:hypothetical protein